ncbi:MULTISPECIES: BACON domain-containing protein [Muribaculaceae]|jgi:hypothetical protein|uniref:BACON domain-containing protein n=1 Tax=Muribaculaceae TaxID=2005473 RepID=UPI000F4AF48D|nr:MULTISPECIES: BACON domain-containing protein [Muribaculaceae]ROS86451.1 hypothetical protein EEL39_13600 [Muribaculaceae bacterium Isolate-080 (Janvier)]
MVYENDGYMMLLDAFYFGGVKVGNISDEGIDWGGDKAEYIKLYAAQVRSAPVKKVKKRDATNVLAFTLIELLPENCRTVMGGTVDGGRWNAPEGSVSLEGGVRIMTGTGQTIEIQKMVLDGAVRGKLGGDSPLGIECEMEMMPPEGGGSPFSMFPTEPFISAAPTELSFGSKGGSRTVDVAASGKFSAGAMPAGFSVKVSGGRITVTATANAGAERSGELVFTLASDPEKKATVRLTQSAG